MSEFQPVPISLDDVYSPVPTEERFWNEGSLIDERVRKVEAMARRAVVLANDPTFQERIVQYRAAVLTSEGPSPTPEEIQGVIAERDALLAWIKEFPNAAGLNEAEQYMAYVTVYAALNRPTDLT